MCAAGLVKGTRRVVAWGLEAVEDVEEERLDHVRDLGVCGMGEGCEQLGALGTLMLCSVVRVHGASPQA